MTITNPVRTLPRHNARTWTETAPPATQFDFDVAIVGLGYVGLPTALGMHAAGRRVLGIDVSADRLTHARAGNVDLLQRDLLRLDRANNDPGFVLGESPAQITRAATVIICVPTPIDSYLMPDLQILRSACADVVQHAIAGQIIILTSTSYVGTTRELLINPLAERGLVCGVSVSVAFSPERIDPGNAQAVHEEVPRVVGGATHSCTAQARAALAPGVRTLHTVSSPEAAEMCKLLENTFRAVNIALINEIADAARALSINVTEVIDAAETKPYGFMRFSPGAGVGGHCIPCDPHYLLWQLRREHVHTPVIEDAMRAIMKRPHRVVDRAREVLSSNGIALSGAKVTLVGVAYKRNISDIRESPALTIIEDLLAAGAIVSYHDHLVPTLRTGRGSLLSHTTDQDAADCDLMILHTQHDACDEGLIARASTVLDLTFALAPAAHITQL